MPISIDRREGSPESSTPASLASYDYKYPKGLNLKPGSELHQKLLGMVTEFANESHREMQPRYDSWSAIDKSLTAFVSPDDLTAVKKDKTKDIPVVVPITYATLETLLTYMTAVFLTDTIFRYKGIGPEDAVGAALLEHVVNVHCVKTKVGLALHTMWRDNFAYGRGTVAPTWYIKEGRRTTFVEDEGMFDNLLKWIPFPGKKKKGERRILFEGNKLENIDPYCYLPDPNVAACDIQSGEFVGWMVRKNRLTLLAEEETSDGDIFNAKYLRHIGGRSQILELGKSERVKSMEDKAGSGSPSVMARPMDVLYMYVNLIPKERELGKGDYPEKWLFAVVGEEIIIQARPVGLDHDDFPVTECATTTDGYSATPISSLEVFQGLQSTLDWLFTSHVANVRKAVNDMLVYDPSLIYTADLRKPGPGKLIRARKTAWGRGIKDAIQQLNVTDVTRGHINDVGFIMDIIQRVASTPDLMQGIMRAGGERRSATEFRETKLGAVSRLEKTGKIISMQAMTDIANFFALHTQQLMKEETYVKVTGEWETVLRQEYGKTDMNFKVTPKDLMIDYDIISHDGTSPGGEYADTWVNLFQTMAKNPWLAGNFDMVRVFKHIARLLGAKNLNDFELKTKVLPNETVEAEAGKGNIVAVEGL